MRWPGSGPRRSLKQTLSFSKPKTLGYGITQDFYLSVLCAKPTLPPLLEVANPQGANGAVQAQMAPMHTDNREVLSQPITRGLYGVASMDHKTVLSVMVMPRDEAGFDPKAFLNSNLALEFSPEVRNRVAANWHIVQCSFKSYDPKVFPSLDLLLDFCGRLGELTDGVIADPLANKYRAWEDLRMNPRVDPAFDIREHVSVQLGSTEIQTAGLCKFDLPELMIQVAVEELRDVAARLLLSVGQKQMMEGVLNAGDHVNGYLLAHAPGLLPRLELIPANKESSEELLRRMLQN